MMQKRYEVLQSDKEALRNVMEVSQICCGMLRGVPSVSNTWAGSYVDRGHRYDFRPIQHQISTNDLHLTKGKQNAKLAECRIPYTVPSANIFSVQRVSGRRQITFSADKHTHNRFTALLEFVRDYPGEQVLGRVKPIWIYWSKR